MSRMVTAYVTEDSKIPNHRSKALWVDLDALQAAQGAAGPVGPQGAQGGAGPTGPQGEIGPA